MPKFIVTKERLARWYEIGEEVEITSEQEISNLLRDGRINVPDAAISDEDAAKIAAQENSDTLPPA